MRDDKAEIKTAFLALLAFVFFPLIITIALASVLGLAFNASTPSNVPADEPVCYPSAFDTPNKQEIDQRIIDLSKNPPAANAQVTSINFVNTGHTMQGYIKSQNNQKEIVAFGIWKPTEYDNGDIIKNNYTVQLGDTLWWIANAHYGNPYDWTKILNANYLKIGILPDGEHALIYPGQVLVLP